ncbi:MAG: hypothetical protein AAB214_17030, partial [Fibrobacterota bacterium]
LQLGVDALAIGMIYSEAKHPINDAGAGIPTLAGYSLLALNRLVAIGLNPALGRAYPDPPVWSSRRVPWVSLSLENLDSDNGWLGLEGGVDNFRLGLGTEMSPYFDGAVLEKGDTTEQWYTNYKGARGFLEYSVAVHPRIRLAGGLQTTMRWGPIDTLHAIWSGIGFERKAFQSWTTSTATQLRGVAVQPNVSLEISQYSWLSLQARLGITAMATANSLDRPGDTHFGFALKLRLPSNDADRATSVAKP